MTAGFFTRGWAAFAPEPSVAEWVAAAAPLAAEIAADPEARAAWLRCGGTWFAGVNVFPNGPDGGVPGRVPPLPSAILAVLRDLLGFDGLAFDRAQISVCYPGYPQPWEGESDAAFRFRRDRDAAHLDGLLRDAARRRYPGEVHGFILGIPLTEAHPEAAPLVVYERSQEILRAALAERLAGIPPTDWATEDVTEVYQAARRRVFETCARVPVTVPLGGWYLVHRLALHGVAPWRAEGGGTPRAVCYFRPDPFPGQGPGWWLQRN